MSEPVYILQFINNHETKIHAVYTNWYELKNDLFEHRKQLINNRNYDYKIRCIIPNNYAHPIYKDFIIYNQSLKLGADFMVKPWQGLNNIEHQIQDWQLNLKNN